MNRHLTLSLLALSASLLIAGHAEAHLSTADRFIVAIPNFNAGYEVNASLLWQQPSSSSNDYAILTSPFPLPTPNWTINSDNPNHHFGFEVGLGYTFGNTGNDVQLNWTRLKSRDSASVSADRIDPTQFIGTFFQTGPFAGPIVAAAATNHFNYDVVNVDAGQYVQLGHRLQTRLFGGVNFLRIKQNLQTALFVPSDVAFSYVSNNIGDFRGFGPRFGMSANYDLCYGFGVTGQVAGSASIGRVRATNHFTETSTALLGAAPPIPLNVQAITADHETRVVPGTDAKLGLTYGYQMSNKSLLAAELGYQVAAYQNAIRSVYPNSLVTGLQTGTIPVATMGESQSDFGVSGPYFNLSYCF